MKYLTDLFSPETYRAFSESDRTVTGFRPRHGGLAKKIHPGDLFLCYVTRVSRWVGVLKAISTVFEDNSPLFASKDDPFPVRFRVAVEAWLPIERGIPIHHPSLWDALSFTKGLPENSTAWTGKVRGSLTHLDQDDAIIIRDLLLRQQDDATSVAHTLSPEEERKLRTTHVRTKDDAVIAVSIPESEDTPEEADVPVTTRSESIHMQALIAEIGEKMGYRIWIPRNDRARVLLEWTPIESSSVLEQLPLNYDDTTLGTVEQIDVLWLRRRTILRAFEVEHTTSIYSGLLRIADLLSLQPNLNIRAHIVAPAERRDKVLREMNRPVFALLESGPLRRSCTYLPYDAVIALAEQKHLQHMSDGVLDEYGEEPDD